MHTKRKDRSRELRSLTGIYKEAKVRVSCYMVTSTSGRTSNGRSKSSNGF